MAAKKSDTKITLQYGDKTVTYDEIVQNMKNKWTYDYGKKISEIHSMELYVKPEEDKVYYVINGEESGDFGL
ncbi:MAG: hypothetical protein IJQ12_02230 [Lachnospiraceae bacterium]|nr:hypothetical protein [Lachnospiraceae bacterium]